MPQYPVSAQAAQPGISSIHGPSVVETSDVSVMVLDVSVAVVADTVLVLGVVVVVPVVAVAVRNVVLELANVVVGNILLTTVP